MILMVNKYDKIYELEQNKGQDALDNFMTQEYIDKFAQDNGFIAAFRVSAKSNINLIDSFSFLIREVLK